MKLLDKMSVKFRKYTVTNLMLYIVGAMAIVFVANLLVSAALSRSTVYASLYDMLSFDRTAILQGQVWRVVSFIFLPPDTSIIFIIFALYFYYIMGTGLESAWGSFKFNVYYFTGIIFTLIAGVICGYTTNSYLNLSLFFAFATIYPNHEILLFFFIPIKIKYLAWLDAVMFAVLFFMGNWTVKVIILFALANYFLFFGKDFIDKIKFFFKYKQYKTIFKKRK